MVYIVYIKFKHSSIIDMFVHGDLWAKNNNNENIETKSILDSNCESRLSIVGFVPNYEEFLMIFSFEKTCG